MNKVPIYYLDVTIPDNNRSYDILYLLLII